MNEKIFWCYYCHKGVLFEWDEVKLVWAHYCPKIEHKIERRVTGCPMRFSDKHFKNI